MQGTSIAVTDDLGIQQLKTREVLYAFVGREQNESPSKNGGTHPGQSSHQPKRRRELAGDA